MNNGVGLRISFIQQKMALVEELHFTFWFEAGDKRIISDFLGYPSQHAGGHLKVLPEGHRRPHQILVDTSLGWQLFQSLMVSPGTFKTDDALHPLDGL